MNEDECMNNDEVFNCEGDRLIRWLRTVVDGVVFLSPSDGELPFFVPDEMGTGELCAYLAMIYERGYRFGKRRAER